MRLSNLAPSIPASVIACLEAQGIRTDIDLLFSASTLDIFKRLPAGTATLEELADYTAFAAEMGATSGMSGHDVLLLEEQARNKNSELHTGNGELDAFLCGLDGRWVIEISGDKGSGKSAVALNLLLHHLVLNPAAHALWVDTTGNFSPERAVQIMHAKQLSVSVLERLQVTLAFEIETVQGLLDDFLEQDIGHLQFFVIDTITPLLGPLLSAVSAQGHAIMIDFMRQLQAFAQTSATTVIVLNDTASQGPDTFERKPALGPSFALMTDTTLWLQANLDNNETDTSRLHSMSILRSRSVPTGNIVSFRINQHAIYPA